MRVRRGTVRLTGFTQPDSIPLRWLPMGLLGLGLLGIWRPRFSEVMQKWGKSFGRCESNGRGHGSQVRATPLDNLVPEWEPEGTDDLCARPAGLSKSLSRLRSTAEQAGTVKDYETDRLLQWLTTRQAAVREGQTRCGISRRIRQRSQWILLWITL